MASAAASSSSQTYNYDYDVFLSFRGEDTRKTFVDYLYSTLVDRLISTYKDDVTLGRGESISPSLFKAIEGSRIAIIIFSERYADSSWCLEELAHIMKCRDEKKLIVMPIFYCVDPSEVRKQKGKFGEAFAKHEKENINKVESWRKALVDACGIAGWEPENIANGHEMKAIKEIVDAISDKLLPLSSFVDEDLVGMRVRMQELEGKLKIESGGVRMVGIWGVGGSGKTTLASSLCINISHNFQGYCKVENIREESRKHGLKNLQEKIITRLLNIKIELQDAQEGKHILRSKLSHSKVLILLDDVDHIDQLEALVGSHNWFGRGSRIIITTRNEQLLVSHMVDQVYPVTLLSPEEAIQLLNKRAYNAKEHVKDYETLSLNVVSYAAGLPLALKVLGSFLCGKNEEEWRCTLARLKDNPEMEIVKTLKISYDGLKPSEKQLFLDIACFFRWKRRLDSMEIFEACGYNPGIGIRVLIQKALITVVDDVFNMHDLVQEMAHYIVKGDHPNNPEKHNRVWEYENIIFLEGAKMQNHKIEAIQAIYSQAHIYSHGFGVSSLFYRMISKMKKLRWLCVHRNNNVDDEGPNFLSNELRYLDWSYYPRSPFPDSFQPMKLVVLRLYNSFQKELWKGYKHLPHLKVLDLKRMNNLLRTPEFDGLPCLQKLELKHCYKMIEIHASLGNHKSIECVSVSFCDELRMFPTIFQMKKLKTLEIEYCHESLEFPEIKSNMESLVKLHLGNVGIDALLTSIGEQCANLISLHLYHCYYSKITEVNFHGLKHLEDFKLQDLEYMNMLSHRIPLVHWYGSQLSIWLRSLFPPLKDSLQKLVLNWCHLRDGEIPSNIGEISNLRELDLKGNEFTRLHFSLSKLTRLKFLNLSYCKRLVEFPELPSRLAILQAVECCKLKAIGDSLKKCKWLCQVILSYGSITNDGSRLLESMLQGNANNMILELGGFEIVKGFMSPFVIRGCKCRLQLPENWHTDFCGFLMCVVMSFYSDYNYVRMKKVINDMECGDDVVWEESHGDKYYRTRVWYVSFASLRHTTWWDETYKEVLFYIEAKLSFHVRDHGFGVRLVSRKSGSGPIQTSTSQEEDSEFFNYTPTCNIYDDSVNSKVIHLSGIYI